MEKLKIIRQMSNSQNLGNNTKEVDKPIDPDVQQTLLGRVPGQTAKAIHLSVEEMWVATIDRQNRRNSTLN